MHSFLSLALATFVTLKMLRYEVRFIQGGSPESAVALKHLNLKATADRSVPPCMASEKDIKIEF